MTWKEDESAHHIFNSCMGNAFNPIKRDKSGVDCAKCGKELIVVYHENGLYSVSCRRCRTVTLLSATDPRTAAKWLWRRARHGSWLKIEPNGSQFRRKCSECGGIVHAVSDFCPFCGAFMDCAYEDDGSGIGQAFSPD